MSSTPFNNSMVTIGKVAPLKSVRTGSLAHPDLVVVVVSVDEAALGVVLELVAVVSVVLEEALAADLELAVVMEEVVVSEHLVVLTGELEPWLQYPTHSPTTLLLGPIEARLFMSAT